MVAATQFKPSYSIHVNEATKRKPDVKANQGTQLDQDYQRGKEILVEDHLCKVTKGLESKVVHNTYGLQKGET